MPGRRMHDAGYEGAESAPTTRSPRHRARVALELIVGRSPRGPSSSARRSELVRACRPSASGAAASAAERGGEPRRLPSLRPARPRPLHRLRPLRTDVRRGPGDVRADDGRTWRGHGPRSGNRRTWAESDCVSCGACVDSCPSGALSGPGLLDLAAADRDDDHDLRLLRCRLRPRRPHRADDEVAGDRAARRGAGQPRPRLRQGTLRARLRTVAGPPHHSAGTPCRPARAERRGTTPWPRGPASCADPRDVRAGRDRRDLLGPGDQRGELPAPEADADGRSARTTSTTVPRICHAPSAAGLTASFGLAGGTTRSTTSTTPTSS